MADKNIGTTAVHVSTSDEENYFDGVAILNLRVMVTEEDGMWVAQGLEIDYAAQGATVAEVKQNFQAGFLATVTEHLKQFRSIRHLLVPASEDVYLDMEAFAVKPLFHQHVSLSSV